jgi:hypothetical protein
MIKEYIMIKKKKEEMNLMIRIGLKDKKKASELKERESGGRK